MDLKVTGTGVSPGIAIGRARVIRKHAVITKGGALLTEADVAGELAEYERAVTGSIKEIETMLAAGETLNHEALAILETQVELLNDPQLKADVAQKIAVERKNANDALLEVIRETVQVFENLDDEYMRARAADVQDIGDRLLRQLNPSTTEKVAVFEKDTILFADDISPSDTIALDISLVAGLVTRFGGRTSHTAILAKSRGIPAVTGCAISLEQVADNDLVIADGSTGWVIVRPDEVSLAAYRLQQAAESRQVPGNALKEVPAITRDGTSVQLLANISGLNDLEQVAENGGEGVGLLRTEMLFLAKDTLPTEEEQFEFYKQAALRAASQTLIIRTLDIGGDKPLPSLELPVEQNPFLGYRAIRICLDRKDLFLTQLRAILGASVYGNLKIMFPMISSLQELRAAKAVVEEAKQDLAANGTAFNALIEIGIMIEVPSAAILADLLAKEVDFFSIGTNDLCQYTLAADRMNQHVEKVYDPFNPGVLRLIRYTIEQANLHEIHVGMCGEMASDPLATQLLLGMGLREFSMSAPAIPGIKHKIMNISLAKARQLTEKVMTMDNSASIIQYLQEEGQ